MTTEPQPTQPDGTSEPADARISTSDLLAAISEALGPGITSITFADPDGIAPDRRYELPPQQDQPS